MINSISSRKPEKKNETPKYEIIKKISSGSEGTVFLVENKNKEKYAIKKIPTNSEENLEKIIQIGKQIIEIKDKNILNHIDIYKEKDIVCIVMEYSEEGDLHKLIQKKKKKNEEIPETVKKQLKKRKI
jgi:serine/threonine protein kinase